MVTTIDEIEVDEFEYSEQDKLTVEEIFTLAEQQANLRNGEVIEKAQRIIQESKNILQSLQSIYPGRRTPEIDAGACCNYRANMHLFSYVLKGYESLKKELTRAKRHAYDFDYPCLEHGYENCENLFYKLTVKVMDMKNLLHKMWPCQKCILLLNPTNKKKFCGKVLR